MNVLFVSVIISVAGYDSDSQIPRLGRQLQGQCPSYCNSANLCLSFRLSFDFHENRSHGELHAWPMCCSEPNDVQYDLSLYGYGQIIQLNDFCVVFAKFGVRYAFFANVVLRLWRPRATVLNAIVSPWS